MVDEYQQLSRQRARCAVQHEREGYYHRAAEAWQSVARLAPNYAWQQWVLLRASICRNVPRRSYTLERPVKQNRHALNAYYSFFDMS